MTGDENKQESTPIPTDDEGRTTLEILEMMREEIKQLREEKVITQRALSKLTTLSSRKAWEMPEGWGLKDEASFLESTYFRIDSEELLVDDIKILLFCRYQTLLVKDKYSHFVAAHVKMILERDFA